MNEPKTPEISAANEGCFAAVCSAACRGFVEAVTRDLHARGWTIRDDCEPGLPDDFLASELATAIIRHAHLLETDDWKARRRAILERELERPN